MPDRINRPVTKFLISFVRDVPSAGDYIVRTKPPRCVGQIHHEGDKVRVTMRDRWDEMDEATEEKVIKEMRDHYFFKYVKGNPIAK